MFIFNFDSFSNIKGSLFLFIYLPWLVATAMVVAKHRQRASAQNVTVTSAKPALP